MHIVQELVSMGVDMRPSGCSSFFVIKAQPLMGLGRFHRKQFGLEAFDLAEIGNPSGQIGNLSY